MTCNREIYLFNGYGRGFDWLSLRRRLSDCISVYAFCETMNYKSNDLFLNVTVKRSYFRGGGGELVI